MILFSPDRAAQIANSGRTNSPIVFYNDKGSESGTMSTGVGTEVESAALSATGTTYDAWIASPSGGGFADLELTLSETRTINAVALTAHNLGTIGATVRVDYSLDGGSNWTTTEAGSYSPTDDSAIMFYFDNIVADDWRLRISNAGSSDVEIAVAFWGVALIIPQRIYQGYTPPISPTNVMLQSNVSQGANLLGAAVTRKGSSAEVSITYNDAEFIRDDVDTSFKNFMIHHNDGKGFFWAWRPSKYPEDLFYGWREGNTITPTNSGPKDLMSFNMGLRLYDNP